MSIARGKSGCAVLGFAAIGGGLGGESRGI